MTRSKLLISLAALVLLAVVLTLTLGNQLRDAVINPVVYFILIFKEFVAALPDLPIWLGFVFLAVLAAFVTMMDLFKAAPKLPREQPFVSRGRVSELVDRVKRAGHGEFFKWRLTRQLSDLTINLIAMKRKLDKKKARQLFEAGAWTQEPGIKDFLRAEPQILIGAYKRLERFWRYFKKRGDKSYQAELEKVVGFLEAYARKER